MPDRLTEQLGAYFAAQAAGIACVYLFGSQARGAAGPHSDLDLAVLYEQAPPRTLDGLGLELAADIEEAVKRPVDLVVLNHAPPDLVHRVLRDGILVYEANRPARVRLEVRSRAQYFDLLPYLQEYRRQRPGPGHDGS